MTAVVSDDPLLSFLQSKAEDVPRVVEGSADGLCLLIGIRTIRNLCQDFIEREIEPKRVADYEIIQSVSHRILERRYRGDPEVINQRVNERIFRSGVDDTQAGIVLRALQDLVDTVGKDWDDDLLALHRSTE